MMPFSDFVHENNLKKSVIKKKYQNLSSIGLNSSDIYLRDCPFSSDRGILYLHPSRGTPWVAYINEIFFHFFGCAPPQKLFRFFMKQNGHDV